MDELAESILEGLIAEDRTFPAPITQEQAAQELADGARERVARMNRKILRAKFIDGTLMIDLKSEVDSVAMDFLISTDDT